MNNLDSLRRLLSQLLARISRDQSQIWSPATIRVSYSEQHFTQSYIEGSEEQKRTANEAVDEEEEERPIDVEGKGTMAIAERAVVQVVQRGRGGGRG